MDLGLDLRLGRVIGDSSSRKENIKSQIESWTGDRSVEAFILENYAMEKMLSNWIANDPLVTVH